MGSSQGWSTSEHLTVLIARGIPKIFNFADHPLGRYVSPFLLATKVLREIRGIDVLCSLDLGIRRR
jgi:hypothetical protein